VRFRRAPRARRGTIVEGGAAGEFLPLGARSSAKTGIGHRGKRTLSNEATQTFRWASIWANSLVGAVIGGKPRQQPTRPAPSCSRRLVGSGASQQLTVISGRSRTVGCLVGKSSPVKHRMKRRPARRERRNHPRISALILGALL
jgi:hypothetical protein